MNFEFLIPLAIVDPVDLSKCVRLNKEVVANATFYWNGVDELMNV